VPGLINASERTARQVVSALTEKRLLTSASHKAPLRLGSPIDVVERWFPKLYPLEAVVVEGTAQDYFRRDH
jgi:hypothetical protein